MAIYLTNDIECHDGGELMFENGDLKIATAKRSFMQSLNWLVASNRGDTFDGDSVADLGSFFGNLNIPRTHRNMEANIRRALHFQKAFAPGDVKVKVLPVDLNEVVVTARIFGQFIEETADETNANYDLILAYVFPFGTGKLVKVDVPES